MMEMQGQVAGVIARYVQTVNALDTQGARALWADDAGVSFIHPRGHEMGLDAIIRSFYVDTMGRFSARSLRPKNVRITVVGDTALAVFDWDFHAVFAEDGRPHETHGRESQVMVRLDGEWKLLHIDYSGMPVSGAREGF